ncbi:MAG TPA: DUF1559 domain-containing protein [Abditibacterium sp.]|jgi:prepilin-type processing-associated H-X9-DG protein
MNEEIKPRFNLTWTHFVQAILAFFVFSILAAILSPPRHNSRENARRSSCQSNLRQIAHSTMQYAQDYDGRFPSTASVVKINLGKSRNFVYSGWAYSLFPYSRSTRVFQCLAETTEPSYFNLDPTQTGFTDYWFNARLSRVEKSKLDSMAQTILMGDGNDGKDATNARYHLLSIPESWRKGEKSPLYRHLDGANFAFADGHVKWLRASGWKNELDNGSFSFRLKPLSLR